MARIPRFIKAEVDACYLNGVEFLSRVFQYYDTVPLAMEHYVRACEKYENGGALISLRAHYDTGVVTLKCFMGNYDELFSVRSSKKKFKKK